MGELIRSATELPRRRDNFSSKTIPYLGTTFLKFPLRLRFPELYSKLAKTDFPQWIQIQTHTYCNARCIMCPYAQLIKSKKLSKGKMTKALFQRVIDECSRYNVQHIHPYLMNEPFLDDNMFEYVEYIREKMPNVYILFNTNGATLTKGRSERLADLNINEINFSFLAIRKETYERIMGLNFKQTLENILYYIKLPKEYNTQITVSIFTNHLTGDEVEKALNFWRNEGVYTSAINSHDRAGNIKSDIMSVIEQKSGKKIIGCAADRQLKYLHILYNGDIVLCCQDWRREVVLGNCRTKSIYDIWNSPEYKEVREKIISKRESEDNFICKRCAYGIWK